jgi:2-dehydropantoate 2-reductase
MNVLIFGAGALGSVFGGFLSTKNDVTLIGRGQHIDRIREKGLSISGIWGNHSFQGLRVFKSASEIQRDASFDLIMVTTKSYDTQEAVLSIQDFVKEGTAVMSMQNGVGNEDVISRAFGEGNTMGGMAIFGARIVEPGQVEVTVYASECLVGDLKDGVTRRAEMIARVFTEAGIPTKASDNILRDKWMKAFYNIALNPLSAILGVPYGELEKREETKRIMRGLLKEAFRVAEALEIPLRVTWEDYFEYLIEKQLPPTALHFSSMLQDIERGRRTEIDYLNGAVSALGKDLGVETPVNDTITDIMKALEMEKVKNGKPRIL